MKKIQESVEGGSDFLKKLKNAVDTGNPEAGKDAIKKINEIHKLAENMSGDVAKATFKKRIEEAGEKDALTLEERKKITVETEKLRIKEEEDLLKRNLIADIRNAEYEIKAVKRELRDVQEQYLKVIEAQEDELNVLKIKYEAKFDEKYEEGHEN